METFILIPKSMWDNIQSTKKNNPQIPISSPTNFHSVSSTDPDKGERDINEDYIDKILSPVESQAYFYNKRSILEHISKNSRIGFSTTDTITLDGTDTYIRALDFVNELSKPGGQKDTLDENYHSLLSVLKLPRALVRNKHAITSARGDWITTNFSN